MKAQSLSKLTKVYLSKFFKNQNLAYEEWTITIDGCSHTVSNNLVIDSILKAKPEYQRIIAEALIELESSNQDINLFLKHLAFESHCLR